MTNFNYNDNFF